MYCITTSRFTSPPDAVVNVQGEIDLLAVNDLHRAVDRVVEQGCLSITLDLGGVSFMDCTGLTALLSCRDSAGRSGSRVRLGRVSPSASRILTMTGPHDGWTCGVEADGDLPSRDPVTPGCRRPWHRGPHRRVAAPRHPGGN